MTTLHEIQRRLMAHGINGAPDGIKLYFESDFAKYFIIPDLDHLNPQYTKDAEKVWGSFKSYSTCVLSGPKGVGKTYTSWAVAYEWWKSLAPDDEFSIDNMFNDYSGPTFSRFKIGEFFRSLSLAAKESHDALDAVGHSDLLIIDDFGGMAANTDIRKEGLFYLIDSALERRNKIIITTNCNQEDLLKVYGDRIADRLSAGLYVTMHGDSKRPAKGAKLIL